MVSFSPGWNFAPPTGLKHCWGAVRGFRVKRDRVFLFSVIRYYEKILSVNCEWYVCRDTWKQKVIFRESLNLTRNRHFFPWNWTFETSLRGVLHPFKAAKGSKALFRWGYFQAWNTRQFLKGNNSKCDEHLWETMQTLRYHGESTEKIIIEHVEEDHHEESEHDEEQECEYDTELLPTIDSAQENEMTSPSKRLKRSPSSWHKWITSKRNINNDWWPF